MHGSRVITSTGNCWWWLWPVGAGTRGGVGLLCLAPWLAVRRGGPVGGGFAGARGYWGAAARGRTESEAYGEGRVTRASKHRQACGLLSRRMLVVVAWWAKGQAAAVGYNSSSRCHLARPLIHHRRFFFLPLFSTAACRAGSILRRNLLRPDQAYAYPPRAVKFSGSGRNESRERLVSREPANISPLDLG